MFVVFSLPGTQRGEALCNCPLAQHCAEEEEDGTSSSNITSALRLPSWSQTLLSARRSSSHKQLLLWHTVTFVTSLEAVGVLNTDAYRRKLHFHLNIKELSFFSSFCHFFGLRILSLPAYLTRSKLNCVKEFKKSPPFFRNTLTERPWVVDLTPPY